MSEAKASGCARRKFFGNTLGRGFVSHHLHHADPLEYQRVFLYAILFERYTNRNFAELCAIGKVYKMQIIHADIVYSEDREHLASHPDSYIAVENGRVKGIWAVLPEEYANIPYTVNRSYLSPPSVSRVKLVRKVSALF